jgi:DNA-binding transcriptional ArsR family regulator
MTAESGLTTRVRQQILHHMVKYQTAPLDRTFAALADPTRRALLARLGEHESVSVSELARPFPVSLPAIMKHLDVLSDAGLITRAKTGRTVACRLSAAPMEQAMEWLNRYQRFWSTQLDRLAAFVEEDACLPDPNPSKPDPSKPNPSRSPASPSNVVSMRRRRKSSRPGPTRKS